MPQDDDLDALALHTADPEARRILERLWESCRRRGLDRRSFVALVSAGAAGSFLAGCVGDEPPRDPAEPASDSPWVKDPAPFIPHGGKNLEARLERQESFLTPNELFFVRNNSRSLELDPESYRLAVEGPSVGRPLQLSYEEILGMPRRSLFAYIECGGNQRSFFDRVMERPATGTQWGRGGIGMAEWTGVPLVEVLDRAELADDAVDVLLVGLDEESPEGGFRRPLPVSKALDPDTLLATHMNGVPLPPDHGFPLRAVVPGWVGSANIKWLGRIEAHPERVWTRNVTTSYVLIGDDYEPEGQAEGEVITTQSIKSSLALPWPARLSPGARRIRGYAHSPHAPIAAVEWSVDDGDTWEAAEVLPPRLRYSWARFELHWDAPAGTHVLLTRATDEAGNVQPRQIPFNRKGYLFNMPLPHPVHVA